MGYTSNSPCSEQGSLFVFSNLTLLWCSQSQWTTPPGHQVSTLSSPAHHLPMSIQSPSPANPVVTPSIWPLLSTLLPSVDHHYLLPGHCRGLLTGLPASPLTCFGSILYSAAEETFVNSYLTMLLSCFGGSLLPAR